ncbi:DUF2189 domain-containing protein [Vibrio gallicus]|uniref:hypothetical protein n=1 Tax=Vibrio gallicus TaxID=190897 RepID=UPI0021C3A443|nr:hypothetical protein [Vibrio gallicus]
MSNPIEKDFNLGGSVDKALNGDFELKPVDVIREAWQLTMKNLFRFSPAILLLVAIQAAIFIFALKLHMGDLSALLNIVSDPENIDPSIFQSVFIANFSYEVVTAPLYAGVALMAMSHAAGLKTQTGQITKGLNFTLSVIIVSMINLLLQAISGTLFPFLSFYLSIAFSNAILLVCEKRMRPIQALWTSLRGVNKRLFAVATIYFVAMLMFFVGVMMYGLGLIIAVPFFFHVKGIIYRNMFGIRLQVVTTASPETDDNTQDDDNSNNGPRPGSNTFDA